MVKDIITAEKQMVLFQLGSEIYGLDIAAVHEIIRMQPITKVPKAPFYVEGVINLRGKVIPVVDMGKRFGIEKGESNKSNRIVVVNIKDTTLGIIVDAVTEVARIPVDAVEPVSDIITASNHDCFSGIAKLPDKMVILLDLDKLLSGENLTVGQPPRQGGKAVPAGAK
ncbi:MAG: chemotaxis protein CheW [Dehalococcoidales bacterium]|nr:chemotaxis protein CheW [Dehalococcoidales bacterium]